MTVPLTLVLPIKRLRDAKSRVRLTAADRRLLAEDLALHTLTTVEECAEIGSALVVTNDEWVRGKARALGFHSIYDRYDDLNRAAQCGITTSARWWPRRTVGVLVCDLPRLTPASLAEVAKQAISSTAPLFVADRTGTGTTFVSVPPGSVVPMCFGRGSARRFYAAGCRLVTNAPLEIRADLDHIGDLVELGRPTPGSVNLNPRRGGPV